MPGTSFGSGAASTIVFDRGTNIKFAEQTNADVPITDATAYSRYTAAVNRASMTPTSTLLRAGTIPVNVEQFPGTPGPFTITGSWTQDVVARRMELIFRQLFNAPSSTVIEGSPGSGAAQALLAATPLATTGISLTAQPDVDQGPVQLDLTLSGTVTIGGTAISSTNPLRVAVCGKDQNDNPLVNVVRFTGVGTEETPSYFKTVDANGIQIANMATVAGASIKVDATSNLKSIAITSSPTYRQTPGMTFEIVTGNVPNTIRNAYLNTFALNVTRDAIATYTFGITGRDFLAGLNPICSGNQLTRADSASTTGAYGDGIFEAIQSDQTPFPGTGASIRGQVGDSGDRVRLPQLEAVNLTFDNGTAYTGRVGSLYPGIAYNTQRTINLQLTTEFHKNDLDAFQAYLDGRTWNDVQLRLTRLGGSNERIDFTFAKLQWSEFPPINVEGGDYMQLTLNATALPSNATSTDAIAYTAHYEEIEDSLVLSKSNLALADLS